MGGKRVTKEGIQEKIERSQQNCMTCEFKVVPLAIEPCKSCNTENSGWTENKREVANR